MAGTDPSFSEQAKRRSPGAFAELVHFIAHNKKWWLAPIIIVLVLASLLVVLGGSGAAPFIYSLF